jgi:ABC-2 type transport system ATP-binding protein
VSGGTTTITDQVLTVSHLVKKFGDATAVNDVSFEIRPGETFRHLGPNGAGKSTIISMIAGHFPPTAAGWTLLAAPCPPQASRRRFGRWHGAA